MKRVPLTFCLSILMPIAASCFADISQNAVDANVPITLQDYLQRAALDNAALRAAFEQWKAAVERVPQAQALPDPRFTYGYFMREIETRVGPQRHRFGIMQVLPWFGKIEARTDAAAAAAKAAKSRYETAKLKLFFEVKDAFYEYVYLARAVEIARENLELVKHFEEVARAKYVAAAAGHPDVIRAQVELAKLEDHLRTLQDFREPIVARLNAVLNRQTFEMLPWPRNEELQVVRIDRQQIIETLRQQNPELQALSSEIQSAKSRVNLAKKEFYPDIGVGVDWIQTDGALMPGTPDSGKDPVILMFSLNLPLWRDRYTAAEQEAVADVSKAFQHKTQAENTLIAQAENARYELDDSARKARLYGDTLVPKAQELIAVSEEAYKAGKVDFLSLIDAQRMLLEYRLSYERAVTKNAQKLAELEMLVGTELSAVPVQ